MSEITVLVLDGHSRAALETLQSLGRAGVQVDLAAEAQDCLAMHSRYISRKITAAFSGTRGRLPDMAAGAGQASQLRVDCACDRNIALGLAATG